MLKSLLLTEQQKKFLELFGSEKRLSDSFYLTGGTALVACYIPYRFSEDLDFFSSSEIDIMAITVYLKSIKVKLGYVTITYNTSFNRNLFFLDWPDYQLKLEFTYFPFAQIEPPRRETVMVDSIIDIATNKLFTIYQKPRSRDFIDLYVIQEKYSFDLPQLMKNARAKFDWQIDPLKLGAQFLLAKELKDYPKLVVPMEESKWQDFFINEARKISGEILR